MRVHFSQFTIDLDLMRKAKYYWLQAISNSFVWCSGRWLLQKEQMYKGGKNVKGKLRIIFSWGQILLDICNFLQMDRFDERSLISIKHFYGLIIILEIFQSENLNGKEPRLINIMLASCLPIVVHENYF